MPNSISISDLKSLLSTQSAPLIIDVRKTQAFQESPKVIPTATYKTHDTVESWANDLPKDKSIVVYCVHGHMVSQNVASYLEQQGFNAMFLTGGIAQWQTEGGQTISLK